VYNYIKGKVANVAKAAAKRSYKLDVMSVLEAIDKNDKGFYANLSEEEQKGFVPKVIIRWLSTLSDNNPNKEYYLLATNDLVNVGMWELSKHPELQYLLMTITGIGKKQYHQWLPTKKESGKTPKSDALLRTVYPDCNSQEFNIVKSQYSPEDIIQLALMSGFDDRSVKEIKEEIKKSIKGD
jgi:hypothetical protein